MEAFLVACATRRSDSELLGLITRTRVASEKTERSDAGAFALPDSTLEARQTAHYYGTSTSAELTASYHRAPAPVRIAIRSDADRPFATKPKPVHDRLERRPHDQQHASIFEHPLYARLQPARSEPAGT